MSDAKTKAMLVGVYTDMIMDIVGVVRRHPDMSEDEMRKEINLAISRDVGPVMDELWKQQVSIVERTIEAVATAVGQFGSTTGREAAAFVRSLKKELAE